MSRQLSGDALVAAVEERTNYRFQDPALAQLALTHASTRGPDGNYERLEFLGDRVLGLVVADFVYLTYPQAIQGELSVRLNALVTGETCAAIAEEIGITDLIRSEGVKALTGRKARGIRADVIEALIAAIYLDGGLEAARAFIHRFWTPRAAAAGVVNRDPKTELQQWAHQVSGRPPAYSVVAREGPDHAPVFKVAAEIAGYGRAEGTGRSKREAEQAAASGLLLREGVWPAKDER